MNDSREPLKIRSTFLFHQVKETLKHQEINKDYYTGTSLSVLKRGFYKSIQMKNLTTEPEDWGGARGMTWMIGYWAILIPSWIYLIVQTISKNTKAARSPGTLQIDCEKA